MLRSVTLVVALATTAVLSASAEGPERGLSARVRRLRGEIARVAPDDRQPELQARLGRVTAALEAGRLYLALYELESAFETASALAFTQKASDVKSRSAFEARWKSIGEPPGIAPPSGQLPAAVEALAASAESRAPATYRASLPYADDTSLEAGLYYLGEAQAFRAFGGFARSLPWRPAAIPAPVRSIAPELDAFDAEITKAYERMTPAQHSTYVTTSVTLKRARALDAAGHVQGALLEYLLARYRFATVRPGPLAEPPNPLRLAEARARLGGTTDHSIAQLFVEMAEEALSSENVNARRSAALILDDVLPAYHAALGAAPPTTAATADPAVTITLVRWPFT